jgi:hypothetical protein
MNDKYLITVRACNGLSLYTETFVEGNTYSIRERVLELKQDGFFLPANVRGLELYIPAQQIQQIEFKRTK